MGKEGPAPPLSLALPGGMEQVTDGRSFTQFFTNQLYWKKPTCIQTQCGPALAQLAGGAPGGQAVWQLVWGLESSRGEVSNTVASSGPLFTLEVQFRWVPLPVISLCLSCSPWPRMSWVAFPHPRPAETHRSKDLSICLSCRLFAQSVCLSQFPLPKVGSLKSPLPHPFILD